VFVSSHLLAEIEQICTHVAVMSRGQLVTQSTIADLTRSSSPRLEVRTANVELACRVLTLAGLEPYAEDTRVTATLDGHRSEDLCRALVEAGVGVTELLTRQPSLEDAFVALTGEGFELAR
jgi:ABC-2 type transport system ATP-binding protein